MDKLKQRVAQRGEGGFTLIELLVVIAILAILAGVVIFAVGNSTENAKVASCKTEYAAVKTAIAAAKNANEVNITDENPGSYLDTAAGAAKYYGWTGTDPWSPSTLDAAIGAGGCNDLDKP